MWDLLLWLWIHFAQSMQCPQRQNSQPLLFSKCSKRVGVTEHQPPLFQYPRGFSECTDKLTKSEATFPAQQPPYIYIYSYIRRKQLSRFVNGSRDALVVGTLERGLPIDVSGRCFNPDAHMLETSIVVSRHMGLLIKVLVIDLKAAGFEVYPVSFNQSQS